MSQAFYVTKTAFCCDSECYNPPGLSSSKEMRVAIFI